MPLTLTSRATVYDRYSIARRFTAQETAINVVKGNISLLVSESEITELKNGNKTMYSKLASVEMDLKSITLAVSSSEYKDINGVLSAITQARASITLNSQQIQLKVSKDSVISSINQTAEAVAINANKINLNGVVTANENFKILADGSMIAKNGSFTGDVYATGGTFSGDIDINVDYTQGHGVDVFSDTSGDITHILPGSITCGPNKLGLNYAIDIDGGDGSSISPSIHIRNGNPSDTIYLYTDSVSFGNADVSCKKLSVFTELSAPNARGYLDKLTVSDCFVNGPLLVAGTKNRVVKTNSFGTIAQSAYETAEPMFGDVGHGIINEYGECTIFIDPRFAETVSTEYGYYVFITKYSDGDTWVSRKDLNTFTISGTPGLEFDWELKAHQKGYETDRLKTVELPDMNSVEARARP